MPFTSAGGNLKSIFITEYEIIDRYVGNQLWQWGCGANGRLGNNATTNQSSPVQTVSGGTNWQLIDSGGSHVAGIKTDGTLWLWGPSSSGELGNNNANSTTARSSPVQTVSGGTNWKQVNLGDTFSAAIKTDGTLWLWGTATSGQLGSNNTTNQSSPVQTVSGGTNWKQINLGSSNSGAIKTDGTLWIWGLGSNGTLGNNATTARSSPVQTVAGGNTWKQVSLGTHAAAVKTDGTLWLWGSNTGGQLGSNNTITQSSPVQTVSGGTNWKQVSIGIDHSAAIKTNASLWLWGINSQGQLGTNTGTSQSSPVQTVSGGTNWKEVSTAGSGLISNTAAIKTNGTLWMWGSNTVGLLGDNTTTARSSPVQTVAGGNNWKQVDMGGCQTAAVTFTES